MCWSFIKPEHRQLVWFPKSSQKACARKTSRCCSAFPQYDTTIHPTVSHHEELWVCWKKTSREWGHVKLIYIPTMVLSLHSIYMFSLVPTFNLLQSCVHHQGTQLHHFFSQMICLSLSQWPVADPPEFRTLNKTDRDPLGSKCDHECFFGNYPWPICFLVKETSSTDSFFVGWMVACHQGFSCGWSPCDTELAAVDCAATSRTDARFQHPNTPIAKKHSQKHLFMTYIAWKKLNLQYKHMIIMIVLHYTSTVCSKLQHTWKTVGHLARLRT